MKRIGILGGLSAESTVSYYQRITHQSIRRFGKPAYPEILIYSVNFEEYMAWQHAADWQKCTDHMAASIGALERAGADFVLIASNTMHTLLPDLKPRIGLCLLDIVECVAKEVSRAGLGKVALFGTAFSMEHRFYPEGLAKFGIECITPKKSDRRMIHRVIYEELTNGVIKDESRAAYLGALERVRKRGAQGVILGCTEIPLLLRQQDTDLKLFDSALIHADAALDFAVGVESAI